jgi:hypothetical protein
VAQRNAVSGMHAVVAGDSLSKPASMYLGDAGRYL